MSELKPTWMSSWARLKVWNAAPGLPVLPPWGALVELAVLVAVIVAVDWAFPAIGFTSLEPSPFWLPVLLLSLQYGTVAGLLAAATATAAYVFNGVAEQAVGENFFSYLLRIWALPILWIGVALVLGQFRLRQIAEKQELRQNHAKRTEEAARLAVYSKDLEERCRRLERELTTRTTAHVGPVLDALVELTSPGADIGTALRPITQILWPGAQVSVFAVTASGCELAGRSGWPATASWATEIASAHPLYHAIVEEKRSVSVLRRGDEAVLSGYGMAAHPIFTPDGSRVIGMFKIEQIDPVLLGLSIEGQMSLIAQLLALKLFEPRRVVANDPAAIARGEQWLARQARGWRLHHWRVQPASDTPATSPPRTNPDGTPKQPFWPRRSN